MKNPNPNAETFRLRAIVFLISKDIEKAKLEIGKALELAPSWENVRITAATIDYYSALASAVLPERLVPWPHPVDWAFVKRDNESIFRLREAEKVFQGLAIASSKTKEERQILETWRLACLLNDPERQQEATTYCDQLVKANPTHYQAIIWSIARNLDVDLKPSEVALKKIISERKAEVPHILALVNYYLGSRRTKKGLKLLDSTKSVFEAQQERALWEFWYFRLLAVSGNLKVAADSINSIKTLAERREAKTLMLRTNAKRNGNWEPLIQHLENSYNETNDPIFLYECCTLKAQHKDWEYVVKQGESLINAIGTADVLRLVAIAAYNAKKIEFCLKFLDNYRHLFSKLKLPGELRRIRALCHRALGLLPQALAEAEALAHDEPTTTNLLDLAQIYFDKGDLKMLAILSRQLASHSDLSCENLLWFAKLLQWEDRDSAISLWRKCTTKALPDSLVGEALAVGYQLGLDKEVIPLLEKMYTLAHEKRAGIQIAKIDDFRAFFKQHQQNIIKLSEFYKSGTIPIHILADGAKRPLVDFYHQILLENESVPKPKNQLYLLARHGGRGLIADFPKEKPEWRLNLDLTALLLAAHLEILSDVEKAFKPLRIPAQMSSALLHMRDILTPNQPSRIRSCEQIIGFAERGLLRASNYKLPPAYTNAKLIDELGEDWVAAFENMQTINGYIVDYLPLNKQDRSGPPLSLPENAQKHLVNCRGLVDALRKYGPLSEVEYSNALTALGDEGQRACSEIIPPKGSILFCYGNISEVLANANLLHIVCDNYKVYIEIDELERVRLGLQEYKQKTVAAEWLGSLVKRINKGIAEGIYQIISQQYDAEEARRLKIQTPEILCLLNLVQMKSEGNDVIWVDDRSLNSFATIGTARSIGIVDVLNGLVGAGIMKIEGYYDKLIKLRAANVLFIPLLKDEVLYHLKKSTIDDAGQVVETRELEIIRRYQASCLMLGEILQKPEINNDAKNNLGEIAFVLSISHAMTEALLEVWLDEEENNSISRARSEWLIDNIYLDHLALFSVTSMPRSNQDDVYLVAVGLAGLMFRAITLIKFDNKKKDLSNIKNFFTWFDSRVLSRRFNSEPQLVKMTAEILKKFFQNTRTEPLKDYPEDVIIFMFQKFYEVLPQSIKDELDLDTEFMSTLGYKILTTVSFGGFNFDLNDFWKAAVKAVNGTEATVSSIDTNKEIKLQPHKEENGRQTFGFKHPETGQFIHNNDSDIELLLESITERENALRRNRYWFDYPIKTFEHLVADLVSIQDPQRRIEEARARRDSSATVFYARLFEKLQQKQSRRELFHYFDLTLPSVDGLLRYLRLERSIKSGPAFQAVLEETVASLITENSIETALERVVALPMPLPATIVSAISGLSPQDREALVKKMINTAGSPVSKIHFICILLHFNNDTPKYSRLARRYISHSLSEAFREDFNAYWHILNWVNEEFGHRKDTRSLPQHIRLALVWTHAHRLYVIFKSLGAPSDWLKGVFLNLLQRVPHEAFDRDSDYWLDVAHPRRVNHLTFLLAGLSYCLDDRALDYLDAKDLQERLTGLFFPPFQNMRLPHPHLMMDATRAQDSLESIFGGDRGEKLSLLLPAEDANILKSSSLENTTQEALNTLSKSKNIWLAWAFLTGILSDLPPYPSLSSRLKSLFNETDFVALFKENAMIGSSAILAASFQIGHLKDEKLREYLKEQLNGIAKFFANNGKGEAMLDANHNNWFSEPEEMGIFLLEPALNISLAAEKSDSIISEFIDILTKLVDSWPDMIPIVKRSVQRLCYELPISQAKHFWHLLVRLRAE